ncbi:MAG: PilT/PilU family type 4a pilus ATPase [Candidatus Sumerlaeia bacterium]|nr:PilT/PilU family type 4a pilus ATPase [Candidatus Sumerlaeia bacterium]
MDRIPLNDLLQDMVTKEASDLYICPGSEPKLSLHGKFVSAANFTVLPKDSHAYAYEIMREQEREEFEQELEVNLSYALPGIARFRVNIYTQRGSVGLVIRRITENIPSLEELGMPSRLGQLVMAERGLVLVTGPTGSGKSTTLAAMINYRNQKGGGHIITIEDPIEFVHRHNQCIITQREVGIDTKSFHMALKNSLRQAPKVIFIGEIRDTETMGFALHASETGHLVLATLHSNNANQTLERISNFFPHDYQEQLFLQLSLNLRAIISQRLLPKRGGGRVAALEIMLATPTITELVQKGEIKAIKSAMAQTTNQGNQTFDIHIHQLWEQGLVTEEDAFQFADSANNLRLRMRGIAVHS